MVALVCFLVGALVLRRLWQFFVPARLIKDDRLDAKNDLTPEEVFWKREFINIHAITTSADKDRILKDIMRRHSLSRQEAYEKIVNDWHDDPINKDSGVPRPRFVRSDLEGNLLPRSSA